MRTQDAEVNKENRFGTFLVYMIAVLYITLGVVFLAVPDLEAKHICYLLAICLILIGAIRIGEYFLREGYKNINQYGFSAGLLFMILGICVIIKIEQFTGIFHLCLGVGILLTAVIKIQHTMDLRVLRDRGFVLFLILSAAMTVCGALILVNPFPEEATRNQFTYIVMIADGVLSIVSTSYLMVRIRSFTRKSDRKLLEDKEEAGEGRNENDI